MLVDTTSGQRQTIAPVWDVYWMRARFVGFGIDLLQ